MPGNNMTKTGPNSIAQQQMWILPEDRTDSDINAPRWSKFGETGHRH